MTTRRSLTTPLKALVALLGLLAGTVVLASPAAAETTCRPNNSGNGELIVLVDEADPRDEVVLEMRGGVLYVDGDRCGRPDGETDEGVFLPQIFVRDGVDPDAMQVDRIQFNLAAGAWRIDGTPVFVNLALAGGPDGTADQVTLRGTNGSDGVLTTGDSVVFWDGYGSPGGTRDLWVNTSLTCRRGAQGVGPDRDVACAEYRFLLRGGNDLYAHLPDNSVGGLWWDGRDSIVKGGSGRDDLRGTPVRDNLYGGKGRDELRGATGNDRLFGNSGDDKIRGGKDDDRIFGGTGEDDINGNSGADRIKGAGGRDLMKGGSGPDHFLAEDGFRDRVRGNKGADTCECDGIDSTRSVRRV